MRYFKKELWSQMNDCDEVVRAKAEKEWKKNDEMYLKKLESIKEQLPRPFMKEYFSRNGMHDYTILGIHITQRECTYSCELQLSDGTEIVRITMLGLKSFQVDVNSFQYCILGKLAWGYAEFDITSENNISLSVLCDVQNEMQFEFETIKFVEQ